MCSVFQESEIFIKFWNQFPNQICHKLDYSINWIYFGFDENNSKIYRCYNSEKEKFNYES